MNVLFVSSGNIHNLNPIIENQGESLKRAGIELEYFTITGKGLQGYLSNVFPLRKKIINGRFDLVHAHYSLSAITATLTLKKPLVVSLMGSDVFWSGMMHWLIRLLSRFYWDATIVKSEEMKSRLKLKKARVLPNGVNTELFKPLDRVESCMKLGWAPDEKHILFPASKNRPEKNFKLANEAYHLLNRPNTHLHTLENIPNHLMPFYYNAADVVLMTSLWEGSPNAIKEAMACNTPVVATDVGDIKINIRTIKNCFVTEFNPVEICDYLSQILGSEERSNGRNELIESGLEERQIARKLVAIYEEVAK